MAASIVKFLKDIPPEQRPKQQRRNWRQVADALRAEPHEWAVIGTVSRSTITRLRDGNYRDFRPTSDWEWTIKNLTEHPDSNRVILLGKFVGVPAPLPIEEERY